MKDLYILVDKGYGLQGQPGLQTLETKQGDRKARGCLDHTPQGVSHDLNIYRLALN